MTKVKLSLAAVVTALTADFATNRSRLVIVTTASPHCFLFANEATHSCVVYRLIATSVHCTDTATNYLRQDGGRYAMLASVFV